MSIQNGYCTITDFKNYVAPRGQNVSTDATDDTVIENMIEGASRQIDQIAIRKFYPRYATRVYSVPSIMQTNDPRLLYLDDDLLVLTTLTNGDTTVLTSSDYNLQPANGMPKYGVRLKNSSTYSWTYDSSGNHIDVISILGMWGYHDDYTDHGWLQVGTLGAAWASTSTLTATLTAGYTIQTAGGEILKIDNELLISVSAATTTLTVLARGDNGSTAAIHDNGKAIYAWVVMPKIAEACMEITNIAYRRRYGENIDATSTITAGGIVVTPRDIPAAIREYLESLRPLI